MSEGEIDLRPFTRSAAAPPARTLVDVLAATVASHPDATAVDDGNTSLTYRDLAVAVDRVADRLAREGVGRGDRVGMRIPSGTVELYVADARRPRRGRGLRAGRPRRPRRAGPSGLRRGRRVAVVLGAGRRADADRSPSGTASRPRRAPEPDDDAWIIFTSGSTGVPKGVAVSHRSAAAFVDAEARLFLQTQPIGPRDRVLAGLSVAFDASCEEMWLAWRHGACLVPAPRALVRSGTDLGPWLVDQQVTVVSTVPTLASLWPVDALARVRLLIFGGEACPPELAERLTSDRREVWNTYGPTEATVVACARPPGRAGPGAHRPAPGRLGPRRGRAGRVAGRATVRSASW